MMFAEFSAVGHTETTLPSDQYKRAVLKPPPSRFSVEFLSSTKANGVYNHGMRISPITAFDDRMSVSTRGTHIEYDIWRRWEDCLFLQETLESEYSRAAREKKTRLAQGKGVKAFNGLYKQDFASSWESLPPGPDPNSVAQDIHNHLPRLTKKGTLFRASQATVDQRQREFRHLVETLFSDDMPALIQEIRASTIVTDFFGLWRRDYDNMSSTRKTSSSTRSSVTSSVFGSYFSESSPSLAGSINENPHASRRSLAKSLSPKKTSSKHRSSSERPRSSSGSTITDITEVSRYPASTRHSGEGVRAETPSTCRPRRRTDSNTSSDSSSTHSDGSSDYGSTSMTTPSIVDDVPIVFGHNPISNDRPSSILEVLPEEREMLAKSPEKYLSPPLMRRTRASPTDRKTNRSFSIVGYPSRTPSPQPETEKKDRSVRESWQTTASIDSCADDILQGLKLSLPHPIKEQKYRASIASIATFMTTNSAEAMFPNSPTTPSPTSQGRPFSTALTLSDFEMSPEQDRTRESTALSLSDFEIYSDVDDDSSSILSAFPRPSSYLPAGRRPDSRPETPVGNNVREQSFMYARDSPFSAETSFFPPPSPTASTISSSFTISTAITSTTATSTSTASGGSLSLKVAHNTSIIMLRVPREITLKELRERIYTKFVGQEGVPLSREFSVAFVLPTPGMAPVKPNSRARSASVSSKDRMEMQFVEKEADWERVVMSTEGSKVVLRILDGPRS
ncbi:hypothetical protein NLJ89_g6931 [Agrocybe chaxingu]|uniref:PX domain-containing protein n=1 Tax=Agrocybe chaxingu TaxID=84603 RepID=A0A9W8JY69_9AGAR|nr:hypothetical protein NLJ89_g6931 [Agrocybe chaxingu]